MISTKLSEMVTYLLEEDGRLGQDFLEFNELVELLTKLVLVVLNLRRLRLKLIQRLLQRKGTFDNSTHERRREQE